MNTFFTKIRSFYSAYKWLLFPIIPILIFIYIIFYTFFAQNGQPPVHQVTQQSQEKSETVSPSTSISPNNVSPGASDDESVVDPSGKEALNKKTLSDGSVEYAYESDSDLDDDLRSDMKIFKNGVVIFQRTYLSESTIKSYSDLVNNPEYTSQGSSYYGQYVETYADPSKGTAIVAAPQIGIVLEQYTFPPLSVNEYVQKYGSDISAYSP